jgi:outer membrane immunogenic protein
MKRAFALLAAVSAVAVAVPAAAQDSNLGGFRIEGLVGYDGSRAGSSADLDNAGDIDQSMDGVNYGVGVGYDVDMGSMVVGAEAELMDSEASSENDPSTFNSFGVANIDAGRDLYAGIRAGVKVGPNSLVYAKGGYTNARYNVLASDGVTDTETDLKVDGYRIGAGAQVNLGTNLYVKGEYRYSNYAGGEVESPTGVESDNFDVDIDRHQFVVGVGAKF